jgi:UDPglucose 6-dehydrogenase
LLQIKRPCAHGTSQRGALEIRQNPEAIVLLTAWNKIPALAFKRLTKCLRSNVMAGLRNIYITKNAKRVGVDLNVPIEGEGFGA